MRRRLTAQQIEEAQQLRKKYGYSKRELARHFEVGSTTIWENIFKTRKVVRVVLTRVCIPCERCEICLTREVKNNFIPMNYQVGNLCIICYLRKEKLSFRETFKDLVYLE